MRYKAKSIAALQLALGSLPDKMRVEVEPDIEVSAKTVGELRKVTACVDRGRSSIERAGYAHACLEIGRGERYAARLHRQYRLV